MIRAAAKSFAKHGKNGGSARPLRPWRLSKSPSNLRGLCSPASGGDHIPPPKGRAVTRVETRKPVVGAWTEVTDPKTGGSYWWNEDTDEVTEVGAPRPQTYSLSQDPWIEVRDEQSGQIYYWNQITDETTAIGEPKPDAHYGRQVVDMGHGQSMWTGLKQSMIW
eukprot:CAMPEP_0184497272 /NCGR_PEP_ID=MMETSP0113_2-20130426/36089_1 /TAXON_ID=91329 /ORGANISM="Norrisiella sphaerica, Strain BC52" /LENGTH=163 /DNA_ID=CAMNT_0026884295 /DNA_START=12 /DNA_END=500 /DNA_ORIENTATION=+